MTHKSEMALSIAAIFLLALVTQLVITHFSGIPLPAVYDEFHYLFAADTFARGHLTNPSHPLWPFFDKGLMLSTPTFMVKFPPGQGALLALGQALLGEPFYGVILSICLFACSFYWMIRCVVPQRAAFIAALFIIAFFAPGHWGRSYMGGALMATGACLVLGSYLYSRNKKKLSMALPFSLGCALLFFTRPYEGGVFFIAVALCFIWDLYKKNVALRSPTRFLAVSAAAAILILSFQAIYNYKITGSAFTLPYTLYMKQYAATPIFWLQEQLTPEIIPASYGSDKLSYSWRDFEGYRKIAAFSPGKKLLFFLRRILNPLSFFPLLPFLVIVALPWCGIDGLGFRLLSVVLIGSAASALVVWQFPHYLAGIMTAMLALFFHTVHRIEAEAGGKRGTKKILAALIYLLCGAYLLANFYEAAKSIDGGKALAERLHKTTTYLNSLPTDNLVFVRYADNGKYFENWVYNPGDIDAQKTVFAYDLGRKENRKLIDYYKSLSQRRKIWLMDADRGGKLSPY